MTIKFGRRGSSCLPGTALLALFTLDASSCDAPFGGGSYPGSVDLGAGIHLRRDGATLDLPAPPIDADRGAVRRAVPPCDEPGQGVALGSHPNGLCGVREGSGRPHDPVIAAAGDIACEGCGNGRTADVLLRLVDDYRLAAILTLGDNAYQSGLLSEFRAHYDLTWGQPPLRALTRPVPGNHDYGDGTTNAAGYWDYFNGAGRDDGPAARRGQGWYSYEIGTWHLIALNSECPVEGCAEEQLAWLQDDLLRHPALCTLAYWHRPRFQRGTVHGEWTPLADVWNTLYDAHADVILNGHEHNFQQYAPMNKAGFLDPVRGMRSFVVGTGGTTNFYFSLDDNHLDTFEDAVLGRNAVLMLTLAQGQYSWRLVGDARDVLVEGYDICR